MDTSAPETKGTVLINSGTELEQYTKTEEAKVEEFIKPIVAPGASVCCTTGALSLVKLQEPTPDELGYAGSVVVQESLGFYEGVVEAAETPP